MTLRAQKQGGLLYKLPILHRLYREKLTIYAARVIPLCFSSPKSTKFELSALLPFRKYIVFSTLPDIKKLPICTSVTLNNSQPTNTHKEYYFSGRRNDEKRPK